MLTFTPTLRQLHHLLTVLQSVFSLLLLDSHMAPAHLLLQVSAGGGMGGGGVGVGVRGKVNAKGRARWNDQEFSGTPFPYLLPDRPEPSRPALAYLFFLSLHSSCQVRCLVHSIHHACSSSPLRSFRADLSLLKAHTI